MQGQSVGELERPSSARVPTSREGVGAGHSTVTREWDNRTPPEGRPGSRITRWKEDRRVSADKANPPINRRSFSDWCSTPPVGDDPGESRVRENLTHGSEGGRWKRGDGAIKERYPWAPTRKGGNRVVGCNSYHHAITSTAPAAYPTGFGRLEQPKPLKRGTPTRIRPLTLHPRLGRAQ
jgi:hypothetical protein